MWRVITDVRNAANVISGIKALEVLEEPSGPTLVGLKWKETREWMGKDAVEVIWITDARERSYYETRAESHGAVYRSRMELASTAAGTRLSMQFDCQPVTPGARMMWVLTGWMAKRSLSRVIGQDLSDIKNAVENAR